MTPLDYDYLRKLVRTHSGLSLGSEKKYLIESRLLPVARRANLDGISALVSKLRIGNADTLVTEVVDAMATKETFFFRDKVPFEQLRNIVVPELIRSRAARKRIRIWCAACSTGQESYSVAMAVKEMADALSGWKVDVVATDLSNEALDRARAGVYSQFEVQRGLPIGMLIKYFTQVGEMWEISPVIRDMVRHQRINLLEDFGRLGMFDLVFCRNVLIYLDQETKAEILTRLARSIDNGGHLVLGAAETVVGLTDAWRPHPEHRGLFTPARPVAAPRLSVLGARA